MEKDKKKREEQNEKMLRDSMFLKKWKKEAMKSLKMVNPSLTTKEIENKLNNIIKKRLMVPDVKLDNNYTGEQKDTNLITVLDWAMDRKPLMAGNATFYKNQHEALNPIANMLDNFLKTRKAIKKRMFVIQDENPELYADLDQQQVNVKVLVNSYYGASGMPKSAFYSLYSGPQPNSRGSLYSNIQLKIA